jgi:hypothetical protein
MRHVRQHALEPSHGQDDGLLLAIPSRVCRHDPLRSPGFRPGVRRNVLARRLLLLEFGLKFPGMVELRISGISSIQTRLGVRQRFLYFGVIVQSLLICPDRQATRRRWLHDPWCGLAEPGGSCQPADV